VIIWGFLSIYYIEILKAVGYGTLTVPLQTNVLDPVRFNLLDSNNINLNRRENISRSVNLAKPYGMDLVIIRSDSDIINDLIISLGTIKTGGKMVLYLSCLTDLVKDLLYIISICFSKINLFKPLSTNMTKNDCYCICDGSKENTFEWIDFLKSLDDKNYIQLLDHRDMEFNNWLTNYETDINNYIKHLNNTDKIDLYDIYKCKAIWNLPNIS
jgi:hypothetical protein